MMISRPQLGVCTWTLGEMALADVAKLVRELNYDGVALLGDLEAYEASEAARIMAEAGLTVFSLTPANVDLAHPEARVRKTAVAYYMRLLDFAAELGQPLVGCRGYVGRVRPITSREAEYGLLVQGVKEIATEAQKRGLKVVFEVLNRYESHLINTGQAALTLLDDVNMANVGILLAAFHMSIEEQDAAAVIREVGDRMWLYHMADSNRQGIGRGHTKLGVHLWGLEDIGYDGPIILECTVPNTDPFAPVQSDEERALLTTYLKESRLWF